MSKPRTAITVLLCSAILAVLTAHYGVNRAEEEIHVTLKYSADSVSALVDGKPLLTRKLENQPMAGNRLGLYMFRSFDTPDGKSRFRNLRIHSPSIPPVQLPLLKTESFETNFETSPGWYMEPGKGMYLDGEPGTRGVCLLKDFEAHQFVLDVDILRPVDVGIFLLLRMRKTALS